MLRRTLGLTDRGWRTFKRGVLSCAIANLVLMAPMCILLLLVRDLMAHLEFGAPLPALAPYLAAVLLVLALVAVTQLLEYKSTYGPVYEESARKREGIAEHLRMLPLSFFGKRDLSDLTNTIMKDCADQERLFMHVVPQLFGTGISSAIVVVGAIAFDWRLGIAAFWPLPVATAIMAAASRSTRRKVEEKEVRRLEMVESVQEYLDCVREIRATNRSSVFLADLREKLFGFERAQVASELATGAMISSGQAFLKLGIATAVLGGAALLLSGDVDFLIYFAFLLVVTRVYDPINVVLQSSVELMEMRHSIRRTNSLAEERPMTGSSDFCPIGHDVAFEDVSFSYGGTDEPVLAHVTFTAKEDEVTALVGPSGSGKSTCAKLACRFWDPDAGRVTVGGVDAAGIDPEALLADFSVVFQDVALFDETVMDNIRIGREGASDEEVFAAARAANCDSFVSRLPQGYATRIGENGARLSGGERQRISIARALLKDAPVVLLDEATASLDVENETEVQDALGRLLAGKTVIVIAHRMRTVMAADHVVVLDGGRVAEQGAPADLMAKDGIFARMVRLQTENARWAL